MSRTLTMIRPSEPHGFRRNLRFLALKRKAREAVKIESGDVRDFLMAYTACFVAVTAFIV